MLLFGIQPVSATQIDALLTEKRQELQQMKAKKKAIQSHLKAGYLAEQNLLEKIEQLSENMEALHEKNVQRPPPKIFLSRQQTQELTHVQAKIHQQKQSIEALARSIYRILKEKQVLPSADFQGTTIDKNMHLLASVLRQKILRLEDFSQKQLSLKKTLARPQSEAIFAKQSPPEISTTQKGLEQKQQENQRLLNNLQQDQQVYFHYLEELQQSMEKINEALEYLKNQKNHALQFQQSPGLFPLKGKLPPPIEGKILQAFRKHKRTGKPLFRGITIQASQGSTLRAVALGKVVFASPLQGYGQLVIVDHGKSSFSVYGNLDELAVQVGDYVGQGSPIGMVFSQASGKAESYFEIRHNGASVNPLRWFKPGSYKN